jgi:hypothetical protein
MDVYSLLERVKHFIESNDERELRENAIKAYKKILEEIVRRVSI